MKKIYICAAPLLFFFAIINLTAQSAFVNWPLTSDENQNTPTGNIQASPETIGSGSGTYLLSIVPLQYDPYGSYGQRLWTGNEGTGWIAGLPDYTRYIQFDASPTSGNNFTVQNVSFQYSDTENPTNFDFHILKSEAWYSTDNWNSQSQVQLNSNPLDYLSSAVQTFSANVNVLVQNGQTFSLRIYPYAPNGGRAMTPSFATHRNVIIEGTTEASNTVESVCIDFENGLTSGWQTSNAELTILQDGENHYLQTTDQSGSSTFFYESGPLIGDWSSYLENGCGSLCWDVNYLYAGVGNDGSSQPITITPTIRIEGNGFAAYFLTNNLITAGDGWHSYCAPLSFINPGDQLPSNSDGQWIMITGTSSDWNSMLSNITLLRFSIDPTSYQSERFGFDNICIKNTGDCNPPVQLGSICGTKFNDLNGDGDKDDGELGLSGWIITLTIGAVQLTDTTDVNGEYCFNNLAAGTYTLSETQQDDWQQTYPAFPGTHTVILETDQSVVNIDFGNKQLFGSICGMKFNDLDGDGEKDGGEQGIQGWTITLSMGAVQMTATTGADGSYCFNNLVAGTYTFSETPQDGWQQTYPANPNTHTVILSAGQNIENVNFGNKQLLGSICGMKFNDLNGDGDKDEGEQGIQGWTITLSMGAVQMTATTGADGSYCFNNLVAGTYTLSEIPQEGWQQTFPTNPNTHTVVLSAGQNVENVDFGNKQLLSSICGIKFNDLNGDGDKDEGEQGIQGWTITLSMGAVQMAATTGADGSYCFNNLVAGTYTLSETPQDGWQQTYPANPNTHTVVLSAGQNVENVNFGNKQLLSSICGMKFNDLDGDGEKDGGEPGLQGWTINLSMGAVQMTATTGADGSYCFNNLPAGTYTLSETPKDGWQQTYPASLGTHTITLTPDLNLIGIDFGNKEVIGTDCTDFENNSLSGWQGNNNTVSIQQNGNNHFIQTTDQAGPSSFFNSSKPLTGNWTNLFANGCGSLCFDVSFLYGGNPYNNVNPPQTFVPYIVIQGSGFSAAFITNNPISVGDGWHSYCAPLSFLNSDGTLPSNSDGHWVMSVGTANDWNTLLTNVTSVRLPVDPTSYQNEKFGFDNICLKDTGDCDSPLRLGSICGIKIHDKNGDGIKDGNEDGIPNWPITLTIGTTTYNTTTDANGNYCFNDLPAGTYIVSEADLPEWRQVFPAAPGIHTVILLPGVNVTDINFSNVEDPTVQLGSICGFKFNDINGDGDQDLPDEVGLPGWTFQLTGASNQTVVTDLNGNFCFTNLRAGSYTIKEVVRDGWKPTAPDTTGIVNVTLLPGQYLEGIFFGNKEIFGSICGMKYNDLNGNGSWDNGEPKLPNWQITLSSMGYTSSGHFSGPTLDLVGTATTDENGIYCFTNVRQGNYIVGETAQNRWTQTEPSSFIYGITLSPGQNIEGLNFGNKEDSSVVLGSICGIKFNDKNGNGLQDDGELGIPDWQIQIGGPVDMTVVTDKEGKFCFENLPPGEYKVGEEFRSGWRQTKPSTNFYIIQLASGQRITDLQFGNMEDDQVQLGSICGTKFNDKNRDGRQGSGESGIANWTIYLEGPMNLTAVTDDNGNYCFYGLIPGTYTVREENKTGWRQTKPSSITYTLEIGNGTNFTGIDFGNTEDPTVTLGSICGIKFNDLNDDGIKQDNEPGIADWTINLTGTMDLTVRTDARGKFCFENLRFGRYTLSERQKDRWRQTAPSSGSYTFELSEDDANPDTFYFGNKEDITIRNGSICGMKYLDKNSDGKKDLTEPGIADWQINIVGPVDRSIKTDKDGKFCFDDLPPGTYIIKEDARTDWVQTDPVSPNYYTVVLTSGQNLTGYYFGNNYQPIQGCVNPPLNMVAWWSFDYSSRDARQDLAGFNNFGTMVNGPLQVAGKVLGALQFDGIDDYVEVADHSELNFGTDDFSFDAWIKTSENIGVQQLVSKHSSTGYGVFLISGNLSLTLSAPSISAMSWSPSVFVADGNWHHIAVTVSRTNKQGIVFYLDGVATPYGDPTPYQGSLTNSASLLIGAQQLPYPSFNFKGILDEIELFKRVLTPAEVLAIYNAGSAGKCKPNNQGGSVSGNVWHDINHNGVKDPTEVGLTQWTVLLNGPTIAQTETDEDGNYVFTDLKPGDYTLSVAYLNNWGCTYPFGCRYPIKLEEAQTIDRLHFGFADDPCDEGSKSWYPLGSGVNGWVLSLAVIGTDLYAGGLFTSAGGTVANNIAKWNGMIWSSIGGGVNGNVNSLVAVGTDIYVGGQFNTAGSINAKKIAKWNGTSWSPLGSGINGLVVSLVAIGTDLYAGGNFTTAGGVSVNNIAKWNGTSWSPLGSGVNGTVYSLVAIGTDLYAGGNFTTAGGVSATNIAKWNGTSWSPLGNGVSGTVYSLATNGTDLYAGGQFTTAGGVSANGIAIWDGVNWSHLGTGVSNNANFGTVGFQVSSIELDANYIYIGGIFSHAGTVAVNSIAKFDGLNWSALGSGMSGPSGLYNSNIQDIKIIGSDIYAGGRFTSAGNVSANNIARYSCSGTTTSVGDNTINTIPQQYQLSQNYPNPFNPTTTIRYDLPKKGFVKIIIYDILGREVRVLVNEEKNPGVYEVNFNAKNLASGIYFYTIRTPQYSQSKKMILLK